MSKLKKKDPQSRKLNYQRLRRAGFNSREANRYKDLASSKVSSLIRARRKQEQELKKIISGGKVK